MTGIVNKKIENFADCEIYNWQELNKKYKLNAKNDSELLFLLLKKKNVEDVLREIDGVYAFAYVKDGKVFIARDIIGVKPLWFSCSDGFAFASERKELEKLGLLNIIELNPRNILVYDVQQNKIEFIKRKFFKISPEIKASKAEIINELIKLIKQAVKKRATGRKIGLLFSGGIDSSVIALVLKKLGLKFTCYTAALDNPQRKEAEDLHYSRKAAELLGLDLSVIMIKEKDVEKYIKKIVPLIETSNVVNVGVALPFFAACEQAKKDGCKLIFSGLGSEEIFAGYERHKLSQKINKECLSGLLNLYNKDTYRDCMLAKNFNLQLCVPFLDEKLVEFSLKIPEKYKIKDEKSKLILREAALKLGLDKEIAMRKKRAAQYGSNFHKAIKKSAWNKKISMSDYLRQFYPKHDIKLGALVSSGKDSIYAMYVMMKQGYAIKCMITLRSRNIDSFMFHTPTIDMVKIQSESMNIPLVEHETAGVKEEELEDLKIALQKAKQKYGIEGIVTGALFSNYQKQRIEKVCGDLGLKVFSPLWHMDQETEMRQIINDGFEFIITKIACEGLDAKWLGRIITYEDVDKLVMLNKKIGINIAFEGGEAETLMVNGPIFKQKIKIKMFEIDEESKINATLIIQKAELV
ncbi:diphthine--ammonia ligase [Candidatus Woesearchaeota archaeon]|nr:diphthine--ammonia ligase [Candidatus Woesearchaeota archaeon]